MQIELVTKSDFQTFKVELVEELKKMLQPNATTQSQWLKSNDVMDLLKCSPGTLQNLRINGSLPFSKIGGTTYYDYSDVIKLLENNKKNNM